MKIFLTSCPKLPSILVVCSAFLGLFPSEFERNLFPTVQIPQRPRSLTD